MDLLAGNDLDFNTDCCYDVDEDRNNDHVGSKAHVNDTKSGFCFENIFLLCELAGMTKRSTGFEHKTPFFIVPNVA